MKIITLIENTCDSPEYCSEHGLSIYIETEKHRLLADTGASPAFIENARRLRVDLTKIDTVILSHGHYDHAGGILAFSEINPCARIYMKRSAGAEYYHGEEYIGIDQRILELPQTVLLENDYKIDEELFVFTNITGRRFYPQSNLVLSERVEGKNKQDTFAHEQCLVVSAEGKRILVSGCAHNGILNILDRYQDIFGDVPDAVISGFHMMKNTEYTEEEKQVISDTARELKKMRTKFYTGHCTGEKAFALMKPIMGEKLVRISGGLSCFT